MNIFHKYKCKFKDHRPHAINFFSKSEYSDFAESYDDYNAIWCTFYVEKKCFDIYMKGPCCFIYNNRPCTIQKRNVFHIQYNKGPRTTGEISIRQGTTYCKNDCS